MDSRCLYLTKEGELYMKRHPIPACGDDEVLIRIRAAGICGSDIHYYKEHGLAHHAVIEDYIPGHEAAGVVHALGKNVTGFKLGQKVCFEPGMPCRYCEQCAGGRYNICQKLAFVSMPGELGKGRVDGAFRDYCPVRADCVHALPEDLSFELGAQVEPVAVALHCVGRAGRVRGKTVAVLGVGPIGLLIVKILRASGAGHIIAVDLNDKRLSIAANNGASTLINPSRDGFPQDVADIAIEAAGSKVTTSQLPHVVKAGGTIVSVGWPVGNMVTFDMGVFIIKELVYRASYNYCNDFPTAIRFLHDRIIDTSDFVTHRFPFDDFIQGFRFTAEHPDEVIKTIITY